MHHISIKEYRSLPSLQIELPDFVIVMGANGSGKTHFLEAINHTRIQTMATVLKPSQTNIKFLLSQSFSLNNSQRASSDNARRAWEWLWNTYTQFQCLATKEKSLEQLINESNQAKTLYKIANRAGKTVSELTKGDVKIYYPLFDNRSSDLFEQRFSEIFQSYQARLEDNDYDCFRRRNKGEDVKCLSEEEFATIYGEPPWIYVNRIIEEAKLGFTITSPPLDADRNSNFEAELIDNITGAQLRFSDLSSGEKVILSLVFAFYNSDLDVEFPEILLMDEPDASLHPSMTRQFLSVIENVFVKEKGIKVIMTTHSPSTVALAPENSLYVMSKTEPRITKVRKDEALKILTVGVPSLSINYENRKQVFVESKYDAEFYEKIYRKLAPQLESEISLDFISSGIRGAGNCDQVIEVVDKLVSFGNKAIFGIIDWDRKNSRIDHVKTLGIGKRYSIENYLFDPVLIAALLLREKWLTRGDLGLAGNKNFSDFKYLSAEQIQIISNFVTNRVMAQIVPIDLTTNKTRFVNGIEIEVPRWYLFHQGHSLEEKLKGEFPQLRRYTQEDALKREIVDKIIDDLPELIPQDILELFRDIQNH